MPTTDIPPKDRAVGTASRCGSPLRALRLLREAEERTPLSVRKSRAGRRNCGGGAAPPAPRRAAPRRLLRPAGRLVSTAVHRPQPAVTAVCACALGPGRQGGASPRSAEARRPRPPPLPSALGNGSLPRPSGVGQVRERAGKRGWGGGEERPRSRGAGRGGAGRSDARGGEAVSGQRRGGHGRWTLALLSVALSETPPSPASLSAAPLAPASRPPHRPHPPTVPREPQRTAWELTAGLAARRGRPCAARAEAPPAAPL